MEIKILCGCGAKFKFDVEPVNGRSPGPVYCPVCNKDSTEATNASIQQKLGGGAPAVAPVTPAVAAVAGTPRISIGVPNASAAAPASSEVAAAKIAIPAIRIPGATPAPAPATATVVRVSAPTAAPAAPVATPSAAPISVQPPTSAPMHAAAPSPIPVAASAPPPPAPAAPQTQIGPKMAFMPTPATGGTSLSVAGHTKKEEPAGEGGTSTATVAPPPIPASHPASAKVVRAEKTATTNFPMGVVGGILGAVIGAVIWYFIAVNVIRLGLLSALSAVGAATGAVALGKHGSEKLAKTVSGIAAVVILVTQVAIFYGSKDRLYASVTEAAYNDRMELARQAANAKTDDDVRKVMADDPDSHFDDAKDIDAAAVEKYRAGELVTLQKFAKGDPSRAKFEETVRAKLGADDAGIPVARMIWMAVWVAVGTSACYKGITGKSD